jgi:hypothetical protein
MSNPTETPNPAPFKGDVLPMICEAIKPLHNLGRDIRNNVANAEHYLNHELTSAYADRVAFAERALPTTVAAILRDAEAIADALPALRALTKGDAPADSVPAIADGGMAIVVQYRCPTNASGARWSARFDRDAETVFKANAGFTFDDKDNEGSDVAAARCLAKFETYCNEPIPGVTKTSTTRFALISRASLGRGAYAYTFRRI